MSHTPIRTYDLYNRNNLVLVSSLTTMFKVWLVKLFFCSNFYSFVMFCFCIAYRYKGDVAKIFIWQV